MKTIGYIIAYLFLFGMAAKAQTGQEEVRYICPGDTLYLQARSNGAVAYRWFRDGILLPGDTGARLMVTQYGVYNVAGVGAENCTSNLSGNIFIEPRNPVAISDYAVVPPGRNIDIAVLVNDRAGCAPFVDSTLKITRFPYKGNVTVHPGGTVTYYAATYASGLDSFYYQVTDTNGLTTNRAEVLIQMDMECATLYPVPVQGKLYMKIKNVNIRSFRLLDAGGREIYRQKVDALLEILNMEDLSDGMYMVSFYDDRGNFLCSYKVIKKERR
ncbi:MAG TPA: Ig-like domain-containing protein [Edaphocola sp.]|nr:Ig-like domain-containing protein [Edaphocola sp.]